MQIYWSIFVGERPIPAGHFGLWPITREEGWISKVVLITKKQIAKIHIHPAELCLKENDNFLLLKGSIMQIITFLTDF